jgi:hypothetical protein
MLAPWGVGVSHLHRTTVPAPAPWVRAGAAGRASDRAAAPTDIVTVRAAGDLIVNVTEDVELWRSGRAPNNGWLLTVEDPGVDVRLQSPIWTGRAAWRLRITYEPEPATEGP